MEGSNEGAEDLERRDGLIECKDLGQKCNALFRCCGRSHCYWPDGFSFRKVLLCTHYITDEHARAGELR